MRESIALSRKLKFFWKTGLFSFKALGFCAVILAILLAAFVWRVSSEPLDISFAKEYIQAALYDEETGRHATMDDAMLYWPDLQGPLYLVLRGGKILNKANETILSVDEIALSFSRSALLAGKIRPKSVVLKKPALRVTRTPDNRIDIGFESAEKDAANEQTDITARILSYIAHPGSEDAQNSIISKLQAFEIEDAQLVVTDQQLEISWFLPHFNAGFFSTDTGMEAKFKVGLPDVHSDPSAIDIGVHYLWDSRNIDLALDMKNFDLMVLSGKIPELAIFKSMDKIINGHLELSLTQNLLPKFLMANISLNDIKLAAEGIFSATETTGTGNITLKIDELAQEKIDSIWPNELRGDNSEKWIVQRMSQGIFKNASAVIGLTISKDTKEGFGVDIGNVFADFSFENMSVDYRNPLPPVSKMKGTGHFDLEKDTMDISVTEGLLGDITVKKAHLFFDELVAEGKGHVDIQMDLDGAVQSVFRYISTEPINMGKRLDMDINKVKGKANINLGLKLPTLPDVKLKDFIITADGTMTDVLLPDLVGDLDVSEGPMNLSIKDGEIHIKGKANLEKRPMDFEWMEYIESEGKPHKSKIKASLTADEDLRKRLGITLEDFLKGDLDIKLNYTSFADNTSVAEMDADAAQAIFFVDAFDYEKPSGEAASAKLTAHLKNKELQKITDFTAKGKNFSLAKTSLDFWKLGGETSLHKGALSAFTLGETKGKLDFAFDKKGTVKMMMDASFLDVQPFMDAEEVKGEYKEPPMLVSVTAKTMRTAPNETVRLAKMYLDIDGEGRFNQMEMDAIAGASAIYLRYKPDEEGKRVFRLKTDDAGAALKAFQVYNNIRGGKMVIYGEPVRGVYDRNLIGLAEITDFKVVDAPSLTKLLSIMSLGGIAEVLSGEGLGFSKLEAEFNWLYRKNGSLLVLKNGRTSGNSIGLTFDGTFDNAVRKVDVGGTIVPMSSINNLIGNIPLVGDILTGGSGGIFAATYSVKGSSENPEIGVNPLAVLTPGILRRILFE